MLARSGPAPSSTLALKGAGQGAAVGPAADELLLLETEDAASIGKNVGARLAWLLEAPLQSARMTEELESARALGRSDVSRATLACVSAKASAHVDDESVGYKAVAGLRALFTALSPASQGDLLAPRQFLGFAVPATLLGFRLPFKTRLSAYLSKLLASAAQLDELYETIADCKLQALVEAVNLGRSLSELAGAARQLRHAQEQLKLMDASLTEQVQALRQADNLRATVLEQELLYDVRGNLQNVTASSVAILQAYSATQALLLERRGFVSACESTMETGRAALAVAQTLARLTTTRSAKQALSSSVAFSMHDGGEVRAAYGKGPKQALQVLQLVVDQVLRETASFKSQQLAKIAEGETLQPTP